MSRHERPIPLRNLQEQIKRGVDLGLYQGQLAGLLQRVMFDLQRERQPNPKFVRALLEPLQQVDLQIVLGNGPPPFKVPPPRPREGIVLGFDPLGRPATTSAKKPIHLLAIGRTGTGKSLDAMIRALQYEQIGMRYLAFDGMNRNWRHFAPLAARTGAQVVVIRPSRLSINPLQLPAHGNPRVHLNTIVDQFTSALQLADQMVLELRRVLDDLYRERQWVHIPLLIERVKSLKGSPTKSGLLRRLLTLCLNDIQLAWKRAWDPVALAEHNGVLEFAGTSEEFKELLTNSVAHGILWHRIHQQGLVSAPLSCCLILDDWARQARRTQFKPEDLTPLEILFGHGRTGGVRVELLTQSRESLPRYLVANCGIRVISAVSDFRDVFELGTDSGFTQEQLRWVSSGLKQDMRILHVSGEEPFVITVPLLRLEPVMTDAMCDDTLKVLASLPVELDEAFHRWEPFPVMDASNTAREDPNELRIPEDPVPAAGTDAGLPRSPRTHARRPVQGERPAGLRDQGGQADASAPHAPPLRRRSDRPDRQRHQGDLAEVRVLRAVLQNNGLGSSRLGRAVGIGAARAQAIKTRLLEQGLIREDRVQLGKRGSPTKCLRITDAGIASLRQLEGTGDAARE